MIVPGGCARMARLAGPPPRATVPPRPWNSVSWTPCSRQTLGDIFLRLIQRPVRRQVTAVFVAVRIADHDRLLAAAAGEVRAIHLQREQFGQDARRVGEIVERLKQRRDVQAAGAARPARQQQDRQHIRRAVRHRDDEGPEQFTAVDLLRARQHTERGPRLGGLRRDAGIGGQLRRGLRQQAQQGARAGRVVALLERHVDVQGAQNFAHRRGQA